MSEAKRHNKRSNASPRGPAQHLGPFRRELLLHLAIREAVTRYKEGGSPVSVAGLPWVPKDSLKPGVELTPTLSVKISNGLAAVEELGYIRRIRSGGDTGPTKSVKVTKRGALEAVGVAERRGLSKSEARKSGDDYFMYLVRNDPVGYAEEVVKKAKTAEAMWSATMWYGDASQPPPGGLSQANPGYRKALLIVRAYVRENPDDERAAQALAAAEGYIKPYRPSRESLDSYLWMLSYVAVNLGRDPIPEDVEDDWLMKARTFDLTGGQRTRSTL